MLLNTDRNHHAETLFIFTIFVLFLDLDLFTSYLCDLVFISVFSFIMINRVNTDTFVLLLIFQNMSYYFWMTTWMKNVKNFQIAKVQTQGVA